MKKIIFLIATVLIANLVMSQTQCVSCNNNVIDTTKYASAVGSENISTGINSFASGFQNEATGDYSFAFGQNNLAEGITSGAFGIDNLIESDKSFAIGIQDTVSDIGGIAIGAGTAVTGSYSVGIGLNSKVHGKYSIAIGSRAKSMAMKSYSFGNNVWSDAQGSITIGVAPLVYLKNTKPYSLMIGFNSDIPTFFVGTSSGAGTTGKIGIGTDDPDAKLDVAGDIKMTGFQLVNGSQGNGRLLQSDDNGIATWVDPPSGPCVQCDENCNPSGSYASVIGMSTTATQEMAFAGGFNSHADGAFAFAFGNQVTAAGGYSLAIGKYLKTTISGAMVLGGGPSYDNPLTNSESYSLMIGFNSSRPTFFVGSSIGSDNTGKIGIGNITAPEAKLHILGDNNPAYPYEASLFIESAGNYFSHLWLGDMDHCIKAKPGSNFIFSTSEDDFVFENGNVGIGVSDVDTKLEVGGKIKSSGSNSALILESPDGTQWEITIDNTGVLSANVVTAVNEKERVNDIIVYPNPTENTVIIDLNKSEIKNVNIELFDLSGKMVFMKFYTTNRINLDLHDFKSGTYILKLKNENGNIIKIEKIIKQ